LPASVPAATSARSRSPAELWARPKRCTIRSHCAHASVDFRAARVSAVRVCHIYTCACVCVVAVGTRLRALAGGGRARDDDLQRPRGPAHPLGAVLGRRAARVPAASLARGRGARRGGRGERAGQQRRGGARGRRRGAHSADGRAALRRRAARRSGRQSHQRRRHRGGWRGRTPPPRVVPFVARRLVSEAAPPAAACVRARAATALLQARRASPPRVRPRACLANHTQRR
jgi:hypothetical protein